MLGDQLQGKAWARAQASWSETPRAGDPVVAVVDDHKLVSTLLVNMLESAGHRVLEAYRPTPDAIAEVLAEYRPALTFLDHDLGSAGYGLGLVESAKRHGVAVALTASDDRLVHAAYLEAGADGAVSKTLGPSDILATVELALAGEPITTPAARDELLAELRAARSGHRSSRRPFEQLTQREIETLRALCDGDVAASIADRFVVSVATVRSHIRSILMKLGVTSQLEAVALAHRYGWFEPGIAESPILMMTPAPDDSTMSSDERKSVG